MSKREQILLSEMMKHLTIREAAMALGWNPRDAYVILHRLRGKYGTAMEYVKEVQTWRRKDRNLFRILNVKDRFPLQVFEERSQLIAKVLTGTR